MERRRTAPAAVQMVQRAEPRGIGTAGARDPLAAEVRLLGALLGQVIIDQEGSEAFELVERTRRHSIAHRREADGRAAALLAAELDALQNSLIHLHVQVGACGQCANICSS